MKGNASYSILQGKGKYCYFTGDEYGPLHQHHIYFGPGMRTISDANGFWVWLKPEWHNASSYGVHNKNGHKLDLRLKEDCQRRFEELWLEEHEAASPVEARLEFMKIIGKNYLDDYITAREEKSADDGGFELLEEL